MQKNKKFLICNFFSKNKRGSHVGFAIAFIIFISFVIFLLNILSPVTKVETDKDFLLKHLKNEIIENTSARLEIISIKNDTLTCISNSLASGKNYTIISKDSFHKVYISDEFNESSIPLCQNWGIDEIGLIRTENHVFETKILELNKTYYESYKTLKKYFNIPEVNDFEFSFLKGNKTLIVEAKFKEIPPTDVFAELIPVTYVNKNANIEIGYLKVVLW